MRNDQARRVARKRCREELLVIDIRNLALTGLIQIGNPFNLCFTVAGNTTSDDLSELLHFHRVTPRLDPRIKLIKCKTFSSGSSWFSASSNGIPDLNRIRYASFNARLALSEKPARRNP